MADNLVAVDVIILSHGDTCRPEYKPPPTIQQFGGEAIAASNHRDAGPVVQRLLQGPQLSGNGPAAATAIINVILVSEIGKCSGICLSLRSYAQVAG